MPAPGVPSGASVGSVTARLTVAPELEEQGLIVPFIQATNVAPGVWTFLVPEGPLETSPRFQPWVPSTGNRSSPGGTAEVHSHKYRDRTLRGVSSAKPETPP